MNEWINVVKKGDNCGWNFYEGTQRWTNSLPPGFVFSPPLFQYAHGSGRNCIIGGVVYRGSRLPALYGAYTYADYSSGEVWALRYSGTNVAMNSLVLSNGLKWTCFGVDPATDDVLAGAARNGTDSTIERIYSTVPTGVLAPGISDMKKIGTNVVLNATGGVPNGSFYIVASANLSVPFTGWPSIATAAFDSSGSGVVTNAIPPELPNRFYRLKLP